MRGDSATWPPPPELVAQAAVGDEAALSALIAAGHPRLIGFFRGAGADEPDDLAADTITSMIAHLPRLRSPEAFEAWFWAIARARFRTSLRRRRRPPRAELPNPPPSEPPDAVETAAEHARIRAALGRLSPRERALLWLREVEGLDYARIGGRLGVATGTVRVAVHRARAKLRKAYDEAG